MLQFALLLAFRSPRYVMKDESVSKAFSMGCTSWFHPRSLNADIAFAVSSASGKDDGAMATFVSAVMLSEVCSAYRNQ